MAKTRCEFCNRMMETAATLFFGPYCIDCLQTVIEHCVEAVKEIKMRKSDEKKNE